MKTRLSKFLSSAGVGSRRTCEKLIFEKKVSVNNKVVTLPQFPVDKNDQVFVCGQKIKKKQVNFYLMLNKPKGYVCSHAREQNEKLVYDLVKEVPARLFTLGRLDKLTTGLIILTNDGNFANKVIHPSSNISKEYLVKTSYEITLDHLKKLSEGCPVENKWVKPKKVTKVRKGTLKIVVQEGLKHEVRKLVANAGLDLLELKRIRIGGLSLGALQEGQYVFLQDKHLEQLVH